MLIQMHGGAGGDSEEEEEIQRWSKLVLNNPPDARRRRRRLHVGAVLVVNNPRAWGEAARRNCHWPLRSITLGSLDRAAHQGLLQSSTVCLNARQEWDALGGVEVIR